MLSYEQHAYFVNALIIIWLSHGDNLSIPLAIDPSKHAVPYQKAYSTCGDAGQILHTVPLDPIM